MRKTGVRHIQTLLCLIVALPALFLTACDEGSGSDTPTPPTGQKPFVTIINPKPNALIGLNDRIPVDARVFASSGVLRVDFIVNETVADSQPVYIAARWYDYHNSWQFTSIGQHTMTIIGYDLNGVASDPVSLAVSVVNATEMATRLRPTSTETPFVIYVTATPEPPTVTLTPTQTPRVIYVTATPPSTQTRTPKAAPTQTPRVIVITPTASP